jgi:hypothetical protein
MKTGTQFTNAHSGLETRLGVDPNGPLRAHRQVADEHVGAALAQAPRQVYRCLVRDTERPLGRMSRHVLGDAVELRSHLHDHVRGRQLLLKHRRAVRRAEDGLLERPADLARVDVERRNGAQVLHAVAADLAMQEPGGTRRVVDAVVLQALQQGARAVPYPGDRESERRHAGRSFTHEAAAVESAARGSSASAFR